MMNAASTLNIEVVPQTVKIFGVAAIRSGATTITKIAPTLTDGVTTIRTQSKNIASSSRRSWETL